MVCLTIVQRDATLSSLFIILHVHSTCFGCQPHPSSGVHKTSTTASGNEGQLLNKFSIDARNHELKETDFTVCSKISKI